MRNADKEEDDKHKGGEGTVRSKGRIPDFVTYMDCAFSPVGSYLIAMPNGKADAEQVSQAKAGVLPEIYTTCPRPPSCGNADGYLVDLPTPLNAPCAIIRLAPDGLDGKVRAWTQDRAPWAKVGG